MDESTVLTIFVVLVVSILSLLISFGIGYMVGSDD